MAVSVTCDSLRCLMYMIHMYTYTCTGVLYVALACLLPARVIACLRTHVRASVLA